MRRTSRQTLAAFTLIELLVVIAIIAILAAILFPVFARAKENATSATCQGNLKQIGMAMLAYAGDNNDTMVIACYGVWEPWYPQLIQPYLKSQRIFKCPTSPSGATYPYSIGYGYNYRYLTGFGWTGKPAKLGAIRHPIATLCLVDVTRDTGGHAMWVGAPSTHGDDWNRFPDERHPGGANIFWMDGHIRCMRRDQYYDGQRPVDKYFDLK